MLVVSQHANVLLNNLHVKFHTVYRPGSMRLPVLYCLCHCCTTALLRLHTCIAPSFLSHCCTTALRLQTCIARH